MLIYLTTCHTKSTHAYKHMHIHITNKLTISVFPDGMHSIVLLNIIIITLNIIIIKETSAIQRRPLNQNVDA